MFVLPTKDVASQLNQMGLLRPYGCPSRTSSAVPARQLSTGPTRRFSAPLRQSSAGPARSSNARSHSQGRDEDTCWRTRPRRRLEDGVGSQWPDSASREASSFSPPPSVLRDGTPLRSRSSRGREGFHFQGSEDYDTLAPMLPASQTLWEPEVFGSWGLEDFNIHDHEHEDYARRTSRIARESREESPPRIEDTRIGKGFSEFLKRGVAQAAPKKNIERTQMVPSKDGGFIATIQKGFEGIFGHLASSKEEVLKMRGPMPSPEYEAVPGDDIDQRVQYYARQLPPHLGDCLKIYRAAKGEYKIGTDEVHLAWQSKVNPPSIHNPNGSIVKEVFVFTTSKENVDRPNHDQKVPCEPLPFYLRHSANIAYDLQHGSKVTKVPESSRLSFAEETGTLLKDSDADAKFNAMNVAIQQAKKREQAAMEWRKRHANAVAASASSKDSNTKQGKGSENPEDVAQSPPHAPGVSTDAVNPLRTGPPLEEEPALPLPPPPLPLPLPPPLLAASAAAAPPFLGRGPIRGLDPPRLHLPAPGLANLAWGAPEVPILQPPILLNGMQRLQLGIVPLLG